VSEFHYVRTTGADGGVDACDGPAIGLDLESILADGLPPVNITLEIIASLCEILDIADQDGEVHGAVHPKFVFVDETGAVSLEGFGVDYGENDGLAPEGDAEGALGDLYGLGFIAYTLLCARKELSSLPQDDPDDHDDSVIDGIIAMNLEDCPEEMQGDIQWFVAKLMSFDWEDRPPAVDAWRTFIAFASETDGPDMSEWGDAALNGEAQRRDSEVVSRKAAPPPEDEEDLGGPVASAGPLAKGALSFGGDAKPGQATAFWSKDAMKAALKEAEASEEIDDDAAPAARKGPPGGGHAATAFFTVDQMKAMADGGDAAPRPKRGGGQRPPGGQRRGPKQGGGPPKPKAPPAAAAPPPAAAPPAAPAAAPPPAAAAPPAAPGVAAQATYPVAPPPPAAAAGGGVPVAAIVGIVVVLLMICGGMTVMGGGAAIFMGSGDTTEVEKKKKPEKKKPKEDTAEEDAEEIAKKKAEAEAKKKAALEAAKKKKVVKKAPVKKRVVKKAPVKKAPAPSSGPVRVTFNVGARGSIGCGDGQRKDVDGSTSMTFDGGALPVSCMISAGGGMWAGLVNKSGTVNCRAGGGSLSCSGP